jgi:hypothetical protein
MTVLFSSNADSRSASAFEQFALYINLENTDGEADRRQICNRM